MSGVLIREAEVDGRRVDVRCGGGVISEIGDRIGRRPGDEVLEAVGGALLPGLHDHHLHLLAMAAARTSVDLSFQPLVPPEEDGAWLRAIGFDEAEHGPLDRARLDELVPHHPARVQHRSGHLWILNSQACRLLDLDLPDGLLFDGDAELTRRLGREAAPDLAPIGASLTRFGITGVTDLTPFEDEGGWAAIAAAVASGALKQRVVVTGGVRLATASPPVPLGRGPVKLLVSDAELPSPDSLAADIATAHHAGRPVAIHCVTRVAAVIALAAWHETDVHPGDRMEHGAVLPPELAEQVARLGLTVVTQPGFLAARGDRYRAEVDPDDLPHLYRCQGLLEAGVPLGGSSDCPYGPLDPWWNMAAAVDRMDRLGVRLAPEEALTPQRALDLYLTDPADPGGPPRRVEVGAPADLCLMLWPLSGVLDTLDGHQVAATLIGGRVESG